MNATTWAGVLAVSLATAVGAAQETAPPQRLFEAGDYEAALGALNDRDEARSDPAAGFLALQIDLKLGRLDDARVELERLGDGHGEVWAFVADSAGALLDGQTERAVETAARAADIGPDHFFAHYQLGLARAEAGAWAGAAASFARAAEIDGAFAYAHYYAGLSYSRVKQTDRMAAHFESFVRLAPMAPERLGVESIMRTLRGR
jgi:tetratricopeptide (TPR) repeat protein